MTIHWTVVDILNLNLKQWPNNVDYIQNWWKKARRQINCAIIKPLNVHLGQVICGGSSELIHGQ